jgi:hypothetical protein
VLGRVAEIFGDLLDVLLGAAAPVMSDVKKDGLRAGTWLHESVECWRRILHQKPLDT